MAFDKNMYKFGLENSQVRMKNGGKNNNKKIHNKNPSLYKEYIYSSLTADSRITLYGRPESIQDKINLFSLSVQGAHHEDLALILDKMGVAIRSGQMCAEPLMDRLGVTGLLRASFSWYNTMEEAEYFVNSLKKAIEMLS